MLPVSSPIEVQYSMAIGTAWAQRRENTKGVTIVTGGDAGTAGTAFTGKRDITLPAETKIRFKLHKAVTISLKRS